MKIKTVKLTKRMVNNSFLQNQKGYEYHVNDTVLYGESHFYELGMTIIDFVKLNPLELNEDQLNQIHSRIRKKNFEYQCYEINKAAKELANSIALASNDIKLKLIRILDGKDE